MRIGFFSDSYFPEIDGVTYTIKAWKERLEENGHEVFVIYPESDDYSPEENEIPVPSAPNPFYSGYRIPLPVRTNNFPEMDIVHCHSPFTCGRLGKRHAEKLGAPTVYTHHTPVEEYLEQSVYSEKLADIIGKLYLPLENSFLKSFDTVTASTSPERRNIEVEELPVGLDMEFFQPTEESFVNDMDIERPFIGYTGRISIEKNVDQLVKAAKEFDGTVLIVGEGPQREKIEKNAPENEIFRDFLPREKLPQVYTGIDVFVTASTGDTLGLSTIEANACGTPVVAPDVHPFNDTIGDQQGFLYRKDSEEALLESVEKALHEEFNTRAAVEKYSLSKTVERLEEIYRELEVNSSGK